MALTPGAAARIVARGGALQVFLEQVEYNGRRLAKLNLPPGDVIKALSEYDRMLVPLLARLGGEYHRDHLWVREQLHFLVMLTLNRAYFQVREREAEAFYDLFRAELDARSLDELVYGSLAVLTRFSNAEETHIFLLDTERSVFVLRATAPDQAARSRRNIEAPFDAARTRSLAARSVRTSGRSAQLLLDPSWPERFAWAWSVPLVSGDRVTGLMQFAFTKRYDWLPREQELLEAAADRCVVAAEKARLVEDLAAREEQVRKLAEHMLHIEEVERRRISRELHDEAGQSMLYIRLQLEMLEKDIPAGLVPHVKSIRQVAESTILETRRLIGALSPAVLEQLGLAAAIRQLANRLRQVHPCSVKLQLSHLHSLPKRVETIGYRLVQECCNNIAKHSHAGNVNISASSADGMLRLSVEDDGVGFSVAEALKKNDSFGLAGMRERVKLLGGLFEIESGVGQRGTRIAAELPVPQEYTVVTDRKTIKVEQRTTRRNLALREGRVEQRIAS
jgi:signal transduction histidine kinase